MLASQRRKEIEQLLLAQKSITVTEVAEHFNVSTETVRRDFEHLQKEGFLERSYGGATLSMRVESLVEHRIKSGLMVESKQKMMQVVASYLHPNDCIFLDHSTTVFEICPYIEHLPLTIVTNSTFVINYFARNNHMKIVCPGGQLHQKIQGFIGLETLDFLNRHFFDKAILSCRSVTMEAGFGDNDEQIAALHRKIIQRANQSFLVVDHTKLGKASFVNVTDFSSIDYLVTDNPLSEEWSTFLESQNLKYLIASN